MNQHFRIHGITNLDIARIVVAAVKSKGMDKVAIDSARRRGVWPLDSSVAEKWIAKEKASAEKAQHPGVAFATAIIVKVLNEGQEAKAQHEKER